MSRAEMQACLARLYTSEPFRKLTRLDPSATLDHYVLTPLEREAILSLNPRMVDFFARSLKTKRKDRFAPVYRAVFGINPQEAERLWSRYYEIHPASPNDRLMHDIDRFGHFLEESVRNDDRWPAFAADMARFERLRYASGAARARLTGGVAWANSTPVDALAPGSRPILADGVAVARFDYDVVDLVEEIDQGSVPAQAEPVDCILVFQPINDSDQAKVFRVNGPTMAVLSRCDGEHTVDSIVRAIETDNQTTDLYADIVDLLLRLVQLSVVRVPA
jgi:hypothetical protein